MKPAEPASDPEVNELIAAYRHEYEAALRSVDNEVPDLVGEGRETAALLAEREAFTSLVNVHRGLSDVYELFFQGTLTLQRHGSRRLRALPDRLPPIRLHRQWDTDLCSKLFVDDWGLDKVVEPLMSRGYGKSRGYRKRRGRGKSPARPGLNRVVLDEIEYMLDTLGILIEPGWTPGDSPKGDEDDRSGEGRPNRHIPSNVRVAVWRRDQGKCVKCGSQERLEFDHIIPVSKGGSNTERNIQLLCQVCNREKSANIV